MTSSQAAGERPKQRRRLLSSSEVEELTAQRQADLLAAAKSHGPYAWTNTDVRNALLSFRQPETSAPAANAANGPGGSSFAGAADKDRGLALALMGVGLTLLSKDLLSIEHGIAASGQGGFDSARTPRHSA